MLKAEKQQVEGSVDFVLKWRRFGKNHSDVFVIGKDDKIRMCRVGVPLDTKNLIAIGRTYRECHWPHDARDRLEHHVLEA